MTALKLPGLPFALEPDGAPPVSCRVRGGTLELTSAGSTDLFVDPAQSGDPVPDAGRLTGLPPGGDFTLAARVAVGFASMYDAGALVVYLSGQYWAKLAFEYSPQLTPTAVTVVTRVTSDDCNSFEVPPGDPLWLRVTRSGRAWAFHASADGEWWRLLRYFNLDSPDGALARVGLVAESPTGAGCVATFDQITFGTGAPKNLRDGS